MEGIVQAFVPIARNVAANDAAGGNFRIKIEDKGQIGPVAGDDQLLQPVEPGEVEPLPVTLIGARRIRQSGRRSPTPPPPAPAG